MISSREVKITLVATIQLPHETSVPQALQQLGDILPNTLRELGFVPKILLDIEETGD
jgi:hypothetical protein